MQQKRLDLHLESVGSNDSPARSPHLDEAEAKLLEELSQSTPKASKQKARLIQSRQPRNHNETTRIFQDKARGNFRPLSKATSSPARNLGMQGRTESTSSSASTVSARSEASRFYDEEEAMHWLNSTDELKPTRTVSTESSGLLHPALLEAGGEWAHAANEVLGDVASVFHFGRHGSSARTFLNSTVYKD